MDHVDDHSYQHYSHEQLKEMLDAARPQHVKDTHVVAWHRVARALEDLTAALHATIKHGDWSGPAADEFHRRLTATARCAQDAGATSGRVSHGLSALASLVADAQAQLPDVPTKNILNPTAVHGGVVGASQGYLNQLPVRERATDQARVAMETLGQRMQVTTESSFPAEVAPAPADMPRGSGDGRVSLQHSTIGTTGHVPPTGTGGHGNATTDGRHVSTVQVTAPDVHGTQLAGADFGVPQGGAGGAAASGLTPGAVAPAPGGSGLAAAAGPVVNPSLAGGPPSGQPLSGRPGNPMIGTSSGRRADEPEEYHTWLTEDDMVWQARPATPGLID